MGNKVVQLGWGHININVSHLETSIAFYEMLGFSVMLRGVPYLGLSLKESSLISASGAEALGLDPATEGRACIMQLDNGFPKIDLIELVAEQRQPLSNADLGLVRLCLASQNLVEDYALLRSQGVEFLSPPRSGHGGLADLATCRDPDGTLIELIQVYLEKWRS